MTAVDRMLELIDPGPLRHRVAQTRLHSDTVLPHERGNCTQAALASLTGLPINEVVDHVGFHEPADPWQLVIRRWCRSHLAADMAFFYPGNLPHGTLGLVSVPSMNTNGAWHSVVVEVLDAGAVKVLWDPAQWPDRPTYDGMVLPTHMEGRELLVECLVEPYDPAPDQILADGYLAGVA